MDELRKRLAAGNDIVWDLTSCSVKDIGKLILSVLQSSAGSSDAYGFWNATTLFRDLVLREPKPKAIAARGLEHSHLAIRRHSVYTLAKICSVDSLKKMLAAFDRAMESDPALVPRLVEEINWIVGSAPDPGEFDELYAGLLDRLVASDSYLNRWAAVEIIQALSAVEADDRQLLAKLKDDANLFVRYQARNEADARSKKVDFGLVSDRFQAPTHYTVADFDRFVNDWVAEWAPDLQS